MPQLYGCCALAAAPVCTPLPGSAEGFAHRPCTQHAAAGHSCRLWRSIPLLHNPTHTSLGCEAWPASQPAAANSMVQHSRAQHSTVTYIVRITMQFYACARLIEAEGLYCSRMGQIAGRVGWAGWCYGAATTAGLFSGHPMGGLAGFQPAHPSNP